MRLSSVRNFAYLLIRKAFDGVLSRWGFAFPYPLSIQIEPTKLCNMRCKMCMNPYLGPREKGNMTYANFLNIIRQFRHTKYVVIQGLGEIFLNPAIFMMLTYLKENGYWVQFATNCSPLTSETIKKLYELEIDQIRLSLDTLNPNLYKKIRGVNAFDKVVENIRNLAHAFEDKPSQLVINMVVSRDNFDEIWDMVEFASKNKIRYVRLSWMQCKGVEDQRRYVLDRMLPGRKLDELSRKAGRKGVELTANIPRIELALNCAWLHSSAYITWDGFVTPCCHLENPKVLNFGNVLKTPFCEIWNGRKYRAFRRRHFDEKSACIDCPNYVQIEGKHGKSALSIAPKDNSALL